MRLLRRPIPDIESLEGEAMVDAVTSLDKGGALQMEICRELRNLVGPKYSPQLVVQVREEVCRLLQCEVRDALGLPGLETRSCRDGDEKEECSVCLNTLHPFHLHPQEGMQIATLDCGHEYHVRCITRSLLQRGNVCPLCTGKALPLRTDDFDNLLLALI